MPPFGSKCLHLGAKEKEKAKAKTKTKTKTKTKKKERVRVKKKKKKKEKAGKGLCTHPPVHSFLFFFFQAGKKISQDEKHAWEGVY